MYVPPLLPWLNAAIVYEQAPLRRTDDMDFAFSRFG
jgi:hypothetical protein